MIKNKIYFRIIKIVIAIIFIIILQRIKILVPFSIFGQIIEPTLTQMIIALFAGFHGAIVGFIIGFLGKFIGYFSFNGIVIHGFIMHFYAYLQFGLYGLFIGIFWKKYNFSEGIIKIKNIVFFCIIQLMSGLIFLEMINYIINNVILHIKETWFVIIMNKIIWTIPYIIFFIVYNRVKKNKINKKETETRPNCI